MHCYHGDSGQNDAERMKSGFTICTAVMSYSEIRLPKVRVCLTDSQRQNYLNAILCLNVDGWYFSMIEQMAKIWISPVNRS